jgi:hypothetical protein
MSSNYQYSINVNEALERYGANTSGSLARRVERLKRFTAMTNRKYADEIQLENARMVANQEREDRVQKRIQQAYAEEKKHAPVFLRRNLRKEFDSVAEPTQSVEIPTHYNLRPRNGLDLLYQAIQNGFVNPNRG